MSVRVRIPAGYRLGALLGLLFFAAVYGVAIVDPRHIAWLFHGDPAVHYLGFAFLRNAPWAFPPGQIPDFGAPVGTSIVFTDSIPLLALLLKPFSSWLPRDFQYFGAWMALCHALHGAFAWRILGRLEVRGAARALATFLLLSSPALALRAYGHEALMAHWLLLASFDAHLAGDARRHWPLLALAALIHAYWVALLAPFAALAWLRQRLPWRHHALGAGALALVVVSAGYLVARPAQLAAEGYGHYSANLLTFLDPMDWRAFLAHYGRPAEGAGEWSRLLPALGQATWGQYEGFAYLGAGVLVVAAAAALALLRRAPLAAGGIGAPLLVVAVLMFAYALSLHVTAGTRTLARLAAPAGLEPVLAVFRATGRFVWPLAILLPLAAVALLARHLGPLRLVPLLAVAAGVQAYDLSGKWTEFSQRFAPGGVGRLPDVATPAWQSAACYRRLVVLPARPDGDDWIAPALFAARHGQSINLASAARADLETAARAEDAERRALAEGSPRADTAYLVRDPALADRAAAAAGGRLERRPVDAGELLLPAPSPCSAP